MEDLHLHKTTNITNEYHMIGMSEDEPIAKSWGKNNFITIDPALFRDYLLDVHRSYSRNGYNFPGRMLQETEHVALTVLYCSIKSITVDGKTIANPFYLNLDMIQEKDNLLSSFEKLYFDHLDLLRKKYNGTLSEIDEAKLATEFVKAYLALYTDCKKNPFAMTIHEFSKTYPDYMNHFILNDSKLDNKALSSSFSLSLFNQHETFGDIALREAPAIFKNHEYIKNMTKEHKINDKTKVTCYDDEYARPVYD